MLTYKGRAFFMFTQVRRLLIVGIALFGLYIFWDNNRLTIVEQDIVMDDLPDAFVGFKILQISDLHEKQLDRKSTRLNSSHVAISYAVFCLKKKKSQNIKTQ